MRNRERGQVLPIWIVGILGTMALIYTALNYGNALRWHIRAQNAADSAAQATLALQSERWNQMNALLYGLNVEEYRIRHILNSILLASANSGGCYQTQNLTTDAQHDCEAAYQALVPRYLQAVQRYSTEIAMLHKAAYNSTYSNWKQDATSLMNHLATTDCNNSTSVTNIASLNYDGGDCAFKYHFLPSAFSRSQATRTGLTSVFADGARISIPSYGTASPYGNDTEDPELFAPARVDVVTCAIVPPIIPNFPFIKSKPYYAVGRASATNVMFVQDWFEPGALLNPDRKAHDGYDENFQPLEIYPGAPAKLANYNHDYYATEFGGNAAIDDTDLGYFYNDVAHDELSVRVGWWNSIPIHPTNANGAPDFVTDCN